MIGASNGTVERRLSRNPRIRKSWQAWELQLLADYFMVPVSVFYSGEVDLTSSKIAGLLTWNVRSAAPALAA